MYTVEIYREDARRTSGERLVSQTDYEIKDRLLLEQNVIQSLKKNERYEIHETYVTRVNAITGEAYQERYDTPNSCSPASETYWSM